MDDDPLFRRFGDAWAAGTSHTSPVGAGSRIYVGYSLLAAGTPDYDWHGGWGRNPEPPQAIFQMTFDGWGVFSDERTRWTRCVPGTLFATTVPSDHHYRLPADSPGWHFWWLVMEHPWAVERVRQSLAHGPAVAPLPADSLLAGALLRATRLIRRGETDILAIEEAAVAIALAHARLVRSDDDRRERLLAELRAAVLADPAQPPTLTDLASRHSRTASAFGHWFRDVTGTTPAHFITEVRLEVARNILHDADIPLSEVARRCGFADATHFGKVFRRHVGSTPGEWRRAADPG